MNLPNLLVRFVVIFEAKTSLAIVKHQIAVTAI